MRLRFPSLVTFAPQAQIVTVTHPPEAERNAVTPNQQKSRHQQQIRDGFSILTSKVSYTDFSDPIEAARYSRFKRAMLVIEISFGHSASQAVMLEQRPKPSASI
jgi:hypothetical protein